MSKIGKIFVDSCKEFTKLQSLVTAALLVALHTVMSMYLSIMVTDTLRISISFLANVAIGVLFGPVMGFVCGGVGDLVQFFLKPQGAYFFGWTLNAALASFIYGLFFYKKFPKKLIAEKTENKDKENKPGYRLTVPVAVQIVLLIGSIVIWFVAPFGTGGNGLNVFMNVWSDEPAKGIAGFGIISAILVAASVIMLFMAITRHFVIEMIIGIVAAFVSILSVYTDRKYIGVEWGFVAIVIMLVVLVGISMWEIARKNQMDFRMLVRISLVLLLETMLINVLLGTYWCSVMYGKGFEIYFMSRFIKNIVQLPINIILTYYVMGFLRQLRKSL